MSVKHALWARPQHHMDMAHAHDHVHWTELFYDLVHVVVIFTLGNVLSHHVDWPTLGVVSALFVAAWFSWGDAAVFNSVYVSTDWWHRLWACLLIGTVLMMAIGIARLEHGGWHVFAGAYAVNRLAVSLLYWRVRKHHGKQEQLAGEMARNFTLLAAVLGLVGMQGVYMVPRISPLRLARFRPRVGHITERFALMILIVLGEGLFKLALTYAERDVGDWNALSLLALGSSIMGLFALAWIYFDFVGFSEPKDWTLYSMVAWWVAHLTLMWSAFVLAVGLSGVVNMSLTEAMPKPQAWLGTAGMAGFLLSAAVIQKQSEPKPMHRHASLGVVLVGIGLMALAMLALYANRPAWSLLCWMLMMVSQIVIPIVRYARSDDADAASAH